MLQFRRGRFRGFPEGGPICDINELLLNRTDLLQQANWVQYSPQLLHSTSHLLTCPRVRHQTLTGCRRGVVAVSDQCPFTHPGSQFELGLEEIHEQRIAVYERARAAAASRPSKRR